MFRWVWVRAAYGFLQGEAWWARPGGGGLRVAPIGVVFGAFLRNTETTQLGH